jgi:hypothetical protein
MRLKGTYILLLVLVAIAFGNTACKKEKLLSSGGELKFSVDTLNFDTVFTSLGSYTAQFKIYNPQNQKVNISSVRIEGANASFYKLNVNGISGSATNMELAANDSMYVFATVNINPNDKNTPFVVDAKLIASMNGKDFSIPFIAYGQNAYYIRDSVMKTQTWKTDKPYVIINNALIDKGETLTIPAGCRIYMHADSRLLIWGTLNAVGTKKDSIIFQGDRLDRKYFGNVGYPGEWGGLYFNKTSYNNLMEYVVLRNCGNSTTLGEAVFSPAAIQLNQDTVFGTNAKLTMRYCTIENSIGYGILAFASTLFAENCLINACGAQTLATFEGGVYVLRHCNLITYGSNRISHTENPVLALINYRDIDDVSYVAGDLIAELDNCIIWGSLENECFIRKRSNTLFNVKLNNCLIKNQEPLSADAVVTNCILNQDPQFENYQAFNFRLKAGSPAIGKARVLTPPVSSDLDGKPRDPVTPDIGCYEN